MKSVPQVWNAPSVSPTDLLRIEEADDAGFFSLTGSRIDRDVVGHRAGFEFGLGVRHGLRITGEEDGQRGEAGSPR